MMVKVGDKVMRRPVTICATEGDNPLSVKVRDMVGMVSRGISNTGRSDQRVLLRELMMLTITLKVNAPAGQAIGIKEHLAMVLEDFGDVRVVNIEDDIEKSGEQVGLFEKGRERK